MGTLIIFVHVSSDIFSERRDLGVQPADKQRLYLITDGEKLLEDTAKLADAGVENDQELALTYELEGAA